MSLLEWRDACDMVARRISASSPGRRDASLVRAIVQRYADDPEIAAAAVSSLIDAVGAVGFRRMGPIGRSAALAALVEDAAGRHASEVLAGAEWREEIRMLGDDAAVVLEDAGIALSEPVGDHFEGVSLEEDVRMASEAIGVGSW